MSDNLVKQIETKADELFLELGFNPSYINEVPVYEYKGRYHKLTFVAGLTGFVMEFAGEIHDAQKNLFEDADIIPIDLGLEGFILELEKILRESYLD